MIVCTQARVWYAIGWVSPCLHACLCLCMCSGKATVTCGLPAGQNSEYEISFSMNEVSTHTMGQGVTIPNMCATLDNDSCSSFWLLWLLDLSLRFCLRAVFLYFVCGGHFAWTLRKTERERETRHQIACEPVLCIVKLCKTYRTTV